MLYMYARDHGYENVRVKILDQDLTYRYLLHPVSIRTLLISQSYLTPGHETKRN